MTPLKPLPESTSSVFRQDQRHAVRHIVNKVNDIIDLANANAKALGVKPGPKPVEPIKPIEPPAQQIVMNGINPLRQWINTYNQLALRHVSDGETFKFLICKRIRDTLAEEFSEITVPWNNSNESHFDAFVFNNKDIIDFAVASSDGGILMNKLQWLKVDDWTEDKINE